MVEGYQMSRKPGGWYTVALLSMAFAVGLVALLFDTGTAVGILILLLLLLVIAAILR